MTVSSNSTIITIFSHKGPDNICRYVAIHYKFNNLTLKGTVWILAIEISSKISLSVIELQTF